MAIENHKTGFKGKSQGFNHKRPHNNYQPSHKRGFRDKKGYGGGITLYDQKKEAIRKAISHKKNLDRSLQKLLKREGIEIPNKSTNDYKKNDNTDNDNEYKQNSPKRRTFPESIEYKDSKEFKEGLKHSNSKGNRFSKIERAQNIKEEKRKSREEKEAMFEEKRKEYAIKEKERKRINKRLSQRTKSGQPKMGPRINQLLSKIKEDL